MKILVIARLFTGMVDSVISESWCPKGLPPFYKFIESLQKHGIEGDIVFSCKRNVGTERIPVKKSFRFEKLKLNFYVLPYQKNRYIKLRVLDRVLNDISHLRFCLRLASRTDYDLIYCDQSNMHFGAYFALFKRKKVVARLYGVGSLLKITRNFTAKFDPSLIYPSFFAPFSYIICTRDGSGERYFLSNFINKNVPYEILINGVDLMQSMPAINKPLPEEQNRKMGLVNILYAGKMEAHKGCREFLDGIIKLNFANNAFYAVMMGTGPLLDELKQKAKEAGLTGKIFFTSGVEHSNVYRYYAASDIYVSLNKLGNISNTTLEAINAGNCIFILSPSGYRDGDTHELIPLDSAVRIDSENIAESLAGQLNKFINDKAMIDLHKEKTKIMAKNILKSWEERMDYEINILKKVTYKKN